MPGRSLRRGERRNVRLFKSLTNNIILPEHEQKINFWNSLIVVCLMVLSFCRRTRVKPQKVLLHKLNIIVGSPVYNIGVFLSTENP